jgi:hypothetical protein
MIQLQKVKKVCNVVITQSSGNRKVDFQHGFANTVKKLKRFVSMPGHAFYTLAKTGKVTVEMPDGSFTVVSVRQREVLVKG